MRQKPAASRRSERKDVAGWQPAGFVKGDAAGRIPPPADSQSAIQQIDNLRYGGWSSNPAFEMRTGRLAGSAGDEPTKQADLIVL